jgi:hypothetical protein
MSKAVKMPTAVKVAGWVYAIQPMTTEESRDTQLHGHCSNTKRVIHVDTSFGPKTAASTLIHEIIHAIFDCFGRPDDDCEERTVGIVESGIVSVIVDNPTVVEWIIEGVLE